MMKKKILFLVLLLIFIAGCSEKKYEIIDRETKISNDAVKITPDMDNYAPILHSNEYEEPVPLATINSAGAEDSPFIPYDREEIYFFFTPNVSVPAEKQLFDEVTGIYVSKLENGIYQKPERVFLQDPGKLSLDGCEFIKGNEMLFCSAREGYSGIQWVRAEWNGEKWSNWEVSDFNEDYEVGELHIYNNELYFHSARNGGSGGLDIWKLTKINDEWINPENIENINSQENEGWPYISKDGKELWFNRNYFGSPAVFRSKKVNEEWQEPELIVSQFAGEPTLDNEGNLYFVHHFYENNLMLEADIYVAYRK